MLPECEIKNLGLIGKPVEHSLSPVLHGFLGRELSVKLDYRLYNIDEGDLENFLKESYDLEIAGFNVTVPYKTAIMKYICGADDAALSIGAVNTLVRTKDGYYGYNTDHAGIRDALINDGVDITGTNVVIIGAGGASRAVTDSVIERKPSQVLLVNRTRDNAEKIASKYDGLVKVMTFEDDYIGYMKGTDKKWNAIQTTSVGMHPNIVFSPVTDDSFYDNVLTAYDIIFNPTETLFLKKAADRKIPTHNGMSMLVRQGCESFEKWTGIHVEESLRRKAVDYLRASI